jgi:branched-chain amino acid transport system permease protein
MEQIIANGLYLGAQYALIALGLTLIFSLMNVLNFAHGQMYVFGGFITYTVVAQFGLPYILGLIASALVLAAMGALVEVFLFRPVLRRSKRDESTMLLAAGVAFFLDAVILLVFGEKQRGVPKVVKGVLNWDMRIIMPYDRILIGCLALAMIGGFIAFMQYSRTGRAMRALAQDRVAAQLMGVDVDRYSMIGFALGAMLAGLVGGLLVAITGINLGMGGPTSVKAFMMIMIGGAGVISGAIAGGFILGMMESVGLTVLSAYGDITYLVIFASLMVFLAFLILIFVLVPLAIASSGRWDLYYTLTSVALLSIGSAGVWLTFYIGRINIGQGAYSLIGGYVSAVLVTQGGVNFWLTLPLAGLAAAAVSVLIGLPILRLRGVYFAMATLVLTEVTRLTAMALPITNGAKGITSIPLPGALRLFGLTLIPDFATMTNPKLAFYLLSVTLMVVSYGVLWRIVQARLGHLCRSLQQNEELAASIGVNIAYLRVLAYAISSFFGGIAGVVFVAISQSIYPSSFVVTDSVNFMLYCFVGGLGYVGGPMLGTLLLYFGWDLLKVAQDYQLLLYSSAMIALMLALPNGVLSLLDRKGDRK